jgi:hypothetical protein
MFIDPTSFIQIADKETGELSGKGNVVFNVDRGNVVRDLKETWNCYFTVDIWVKDGKYKYKFSNLRYYKNNLADTSRFTVQMRTNPALSKEANNREEAAFKDIKIGLDKKFQLLTEELVQAMKIESNREAF